MAFIVLKRGGLFQKFAARVAAATGHPAAFCVAVGIIALWAVTGPMFGFSDTGRPDLLADTSGSKPDV